MFNLVSNKRVLAFAQTNRHHLNTYIPSPNSKKKPKDKLNASGVWMLFNINVNVTRDKLGNGKNMPLWRK